MIREERRAGAPEDDVNPEMLAAGKDIFREFFYDAWEMTTSEYKDEFVKKLFYAMLEHRTSQAV